jgi:hypothetical protein
MGLFRKMASVSTLGAVDMRSDKERTARKTAKAARYAKVAAKEAKAQAAIMRADSLSQQTADGEQRRLATAAYQERVKAEKLAAARQPVARPIAERLAELNAMCDQGLITSVERDGRRVEILREV